MLTLLLIALQVKVSLLFLGENRFTTFSISGTISDGHA